MSNRRFTVKDAGGGWILIDRPKGAIVTPRMVFSAPPNSLPKDEHDVGTEAAGSRIETETRHERER